MAASQDNSLLFSLKELEDIEHGRVANERAAALARQEAERRAFFERERLEREAESRRLEEHERRRRAEEARRREEEARLVAIERAEVERARAEVEARSHVELERARETHELELERARSRGARGTYRFLLLVSSLMTMAAAGFAAVTSAELRERERLDATRSEVEGRERAQYEQTVRALQATRAEVDDLQRRFEKLRASAASPPSATPPAPPRGTPSSPKAKGKGKAASNAGSGQQCGLDGDPLNGCLPSR